MALDRMLLHALQYPRANDFDHRKQEEFRALVVWLENMKIRLYKQQDRKNLSNVNSPHWEDTFGKYLKDMECPIPFNGDEKGSALAWLLKSAMDYEYQDDAQEYNRFAAEASSSQVGTKFDSASFADASSHVVRDMLSKICKKLHVDSSEEKPAHQAKAIAESLRSQVLPSLSHSKHQGFDWQEYPLGFSTGDPVVDKAATVLRMLFIKDLRRLQTTIDETIVQAQEYTANPRTDAKLGRVGV